MFNRPALAALMISAVAAPAGAQILVSDPIHTAITSSSWIAQAADMAQQYQQMVQQYRQLQQTYAAMTGGRGMETLAGMSYQQRNYLPDTYNGVRNSNAVNSYVDSNAVLSAAEMAGLNPMQRQQIESGRRAAATAQMASESGYRNASQGFQRVQTLIDSIGGATDAKAIADLQGRVAGEQAMLATEQNKLAMLRASLDADRRTMEQQRVERTLQGVGDIRTLPTVRYWQ